CGSTLRFRGLEAADLDRLVSDHRAMVERQAAARDGRILKSDGDGLWLSFPSVTAAALAARAMQEELQLAKWSGADAGVPRHCAITGGGVGHQEPESVGDAGALAARRGGVPPQDEIYLSAGAWHGVNPAEVRTAPVDSFTLKGFDEPVPVYR